MAGAPSDAGTAAGVASAVRPEVLKQRSQFLAVAATRRRIGMGTVVVQMRRQSPAEIAAGAAPLRYGLTASKKVGNAVTRNRARRRLRALALALLPQMVPPHHDIVLIARRETAECAAWTLRGDLETALRRLLRDKRGQVPGTMAQQEGERP